MKRILFGVLSLAVAAGCGAGMAGAETADEAASVNPALDKIMSCHAIAYSVWELVLGVKVIAEVPLNKYGQNQYREEDAVFGQTAAVAKLIEFTQETEGTLTECSTKALELARPDPAAHLAALKYLEEIRGAAAKAKEVRAALDALADQARTEDAATWWSMMGDLSGMMDVRLVPSAEELVKKTAP